MGQKEATMKCLVTGSEGFIGKNLVARLEQDGHEVIGFDIKPEDNDCRDIPFLMPSRNADVIFHLACVNQMQAVNSPVENLDINALTTRILANFAAKHGIKFIYTSTASVYGNAKTIPTPVDAKLQPLTDYAVAKLAGEYFVQNSGADWTILRLSNVYGPHQTLDNPYCGVIGRFFEQARKEEPLTVIGNGTQTRDFTYVGDVVDKLLLAATLDSEKWNHKIWNVSHGSELPIWKLPSYISDAFSTSLQIQKIETRPIDGIERRCLIPDLRCFTTLPEGLKLTKKWFDERT